VLFSLILQSTAPVSPYASYFQYVPFVGIALVFYFMILQPTQRQKKRQQEMLSQLKSGDVVTTTGGIVGTIVSAEADTIVLRVKPDNVKLQFSRTAVGAVIAPDAKDKK
jgi:preprotein translocase subunit YajC